MTQSLNDESRIHIEQIAGEALAQLERIAETARGKLNDGRTLGSDALANINTMTSSSAIQRLDKISQANRESYQVLVTEPSIARVVVSDEEGDEKIYYICGTMPVSGFPNLSSYRAPVGRLPKHSTQPWRSTTSRSSPAEKARLWGRKAMCACSTSSISKALSLRRYSLSALTSSPRCTRHCSTNTCTSVPPARPPTWA